MAAYFFTALCALVLDQLTKLWTVENIALGQQVEFIPGVLGLTYFRNTGMALSLLSEHTWVLAALSVVSLPVLGWLLTRKKWFTRWERFAIALVMGGAAGNAVDRVFRGYVVDMLEPLFINFAVFNIADAFINVGAILFCLLYIIRAFKDDGWKRSGGSETGERIEDDGNGGGRRHQD